MRRLLVANRGEIALRVFRACREEGIETVAVAAPDDRGSLHAEAADSFVEISSYLDPAEHVRAARESGADAVHPGYGFLSESAEFAEAVIEAGLTWVGPPPAALRAGGDKLAAKETARAAGVPVLLTGTPEEIGFPLLVKAAAGGGGRGMRVVRTEPELADALDAARREAGAAFGDDTVFCERYLERPRHVEIQILADSHGNVVALGERDCSIQRRHQKVLEESPSPALDPELRQRMSGAAVAFARAIGYESAGTAEFVLDGRDFYFLELNARIQVEHPVTELVTGVDLVREQLRIASGEAMSESAANCHLRGCAVEVRLYAEDPRTFLPQAGTLERLRLPEGVRVDSGVREGDEIGTSYDPMIAKLIAAGDTREEAFDRLAAALRDTEVGGVTTNLPFLRWLVAHPLVRAGRVTTAFLTENPPLSNPPAQAPAAAWSAPWRLNLPSPPSRPAPDVDSARGTSAAGAQEQSAVTAPMPGTVIRVLVEPGEQVTARQPLVVLEAMKMETPLVSPFDGTVRAVHVAEGDRVAGGALLVELDE
ncbi:MAG: 3-methylcrotonyl-CoA carboxylase alpha subunit [Gaiellaceae bacterium]|jgi:acetyl/propionyl-CoA carboxylase alpha subunit|nr:3-methylcrotonyl-CoA carboxylase alpha subunit [Gaiellaceae bacterium]